MNHYEETLSSEEYELEFNDTQDAKTTTYVEAYSEQLVDYIQTGIGKDDQEAKEDLLENLDELLNFLETVRTKIRYDLIPVEYTTVKGVV